MDDCDRRTANSLDEALEAVENLDVRVKDEPLDNVGDILMDDELRLQLEESIEMVVNELSTPENDEPSNAASFQDPNSNIESDNGEHVNDSAAAATTSSTSALDPIIDSMNDLEGTLDPDLQAVCDVLRMANGASPVLRRSANDAVNVEALEPMSNTSAKQAAGLNVKREPRDIVSSNPFSSVSSSSYSSTSTSSVSSSNEMTGEKTRAHSSNPIDLLTMLSLDKKPSALSILPVKSGKNLPSTKVTNNNVEFALMPDVTIRSVPSSTTISTTSSSSASSFSTSGKYFPTNDDSWKVLPRKNPGLSFSLPTDSRLPPDNAMFSRSRSPDSFSSSLSCNGASVGNVKTTNASSMSFACCPTLPSRSVDVTNNNNCSSVYFNQKTPNAARPASCSYSNYNNCRRMSPYPPQYQHVSYSGSRSPGARVPGPYCLPAARPFNPSNSAAFGVNPVMNGSCCTSAVASSISPSLMMNSKASNYPALPPLLPPSPLNQCRMPLSPASPSFMRSSREYANMFPDSTGSVPASASESALTCMQQQQQQQQSSFRPTASGWTGPLNTFHAPGASRSSFSLPPSKSGRGPSMSTILPHSSSAPCKNQLFPSPSGNFDYALPAKNGGPVGTVSATNAYGSALSDDFSSTSSPFQRAQCCFSSQIQCFNAACDNTAQQQVSIIQHSTRLSNLKSNSMDSISSLLHYHSYFKKY